MSEVPHVLSAASFTPVKLEPIFLRALELRGLDQDPRSRKANAGKFLGARAVNLFYQESTRTRTSFEMAEAAWGIGFSSTPNARQFSSEVKGETLEHTLAVVAQYRPDFVVIRHDEVGGAAKAAAASGEVPIINAGDGKGEHPTQAILDAYTIWEELGRLDNLRVTFMGDLRFGRTIRSLIHVLQKSQNNHFDFISAPDLSLSDDIKAILDATPGATYREFNSAEALKEVLPETDVLYVTRTQKNLGAQVIESGEFKITKNDADLLPPHAIILHPMPIDRSDPQLSEIAPEVDAHPRAMYFKQAGNGLYTRMALIERILNGTHQL